MGRQTGRVDTSAERAGRSDPVAASDDVLVRPAGRFRVVEAKVIAEKVASDHRPVLEVVELLP